MRLHLLFGLTIGLIAAVATTPAVAASARPAASGARVAAATPAQEVLAVVNGEAITKDALVRRLLALSTAGQDMLEQMINDALLFQAAKAKGIRVTDAEADARIADAKKEFPTEEEFRRGLAQRQVTEAGFRDRMRANIAAEKLHADKSQVTDDEVKEAYEKSKAYFSVPETYALSGVITASEERAKQAMVRLDKGEDFGDVAKALSEDANTAAKGGALGNVRAVSMPPVLAQAVGKTEIGKYTQPVQVEDRYYILKVEAHTPAATKSLDEVKDKIREQIKENKLQQAYLAWLDEARKNAAIDRKWKP